MRGGAPCNSIVPCAVFQNDRHSFDRLNEPCIQYVSEYDVPSEKLHPIFLTSDIGNWYVENLKKNRKKEKVKNFGVRVFPGGPPGAPKGTRERRKKPNLPYHYVIRKDYVKLRKQGHAAAEVVVDAARRMVAATRHAAKASAIVAATAAKEARRTASWPLRVTNV